MDAQEKPFDTVSIVILVLLGLINDSVEIFCDLLTAVVVGIPSQVIMQPVNFLVTCIVVPWFFVKTGSFTSVSSLATIITAPLGQFGIPCRTIVLVTGIYVANHPKSIISEASNVVDMKRKLSAPQGARNIYSRNGVGVTKEEFEAGMAQRDASRGTVRVASAGMTKEGVQPAREEGGEDEEARRLKEEEMEKKLESGAEISPEEEAEGVDFGRTSQQTSQASEQEGDEDREVDNQPQSPNVVSIEEGRRAKREKEVKENLEHPHAPRDITAGDEGGGSPSDKVIPFADVRKPQDNNQLDKAA
jgi:hypothetical protein